MSIRDQVVRLLFPDWIYGWPTGWEEEDEEEEDLPWWA